MKNLDTMQLNRAQKYYINSLLSIMEKKQYNDITVQEISEKAEYDRRTYYRYFNAKEDILRLHCSHILGEMADMMHYEESLTFKAGIIAYFSFWKNHIDFLKLLQRNGLLHFLEDEQDNLFYQYVGLSVQPEIPQPLETASPLSKYAFYFTSGGLWNTLVYWIKEEAQQTPEEMAEYILLTFTEIGNTIKEQAIAP